MTGAVYDVQVSRRGIMVTVVRTEVIETAFALAHFFEAENRVVVITRTTPPTRGAYVVYRSSEKA